MLPTSTQRTGRKAPAGRAARKPLSRVVVLFVALSALSQVMITLVCSMFEMRLRIELFPEVLILACFLMSYTAGWISKKRDVITTKSEIDTVAFDGGHKGNLTVPSGWYSSVRSLITTKSMIGKVAFDGGHRASSALPSSEGASPKELCNGSPKNSGDRVGNNRRLPSDTCAIDCARTEGLAPKVPKFLEAMHACIRHRQVDTALKLFYQMLEEGVGDDAHLVGKVTADRFFNLVADNLDVRRMRKDGLSLFDVVQAHGLVPSTTIQNRLIIAWKSKPPKSVVDYLIRIKNAGHLISRLAYFSMMISSQQSDPEMTLKLCDEMESLGIKPDRVAYNAVLSACKNLGLYDKAGLLFAQMADRGLIPDTKTYRVMINVSANNGKFKEAVAFLETMREQGLKPDRWDYHNAIHSWIRLQRADYAVELYDEMVRAEVIPRERTVAYLRAACQMSGLTSSAI